jgi:2-amino-4-hydroxy-6-hydroxymethyldihydropteridine diphosphokinase
VTAAFIGLGANLGDPQRQVQQGYAEQPSFVNAVAQVETGLPAERLLAELQAIEAAHGRRRSFANAPRTLDLDLLLFGNAAIDAPGLKIPHPRMHERAFVLRPLVEIAEDIAIPGRGSAMAFLEICKDQGVEKLD